MPDITLCTSLYCPARTYCARSVSTPSGLQSYFSPPPKYNKTIAAIKEDTSFILLLRGCEYFLPVPRVKLVSIDKGTDYQQKSKLTVSGIRGR